MTKNFEVVLPYVKQNIIIGTDILMDQLIAVTKNYSQIVILVDINAFEARLKDDIGKLAELLGNEKVYVIKVFPDRYFKSVEYSLNIFTQLAEQGMTRNTLLVAMGGGFVGDIGGFVASVYLRGIDFVQVGTTLMSQGDAIIGKVAVNLGKRKNVVGSFFSPKLTVCDTALILNDQDEILLAVSEFFKHYLFLSDNSNVVSENIAILNILLEKNAQLPLWIDAIEKSLQVKAQIVQDDPYDRNGNHKKLSFGHTFANILESQLHMRHGEAVWTGMYLATRLLINLKVKECDTDFCSYILSSINKFYSFDTFKKLRINKLRIEQAILSDKITKDNTPTFVLCPQPGRHKIVQTDIKQVLPLFDELFTLT